MSELESVTVSQDRGLRANRLSHDFDWLLSFCFVTSFKTIDLKFHIYLFWNYIKNDTDSFSLFAASENASLTNLAITLPCI